MLDFDVSRLPADPAEWQALVDALTRTDDYSETHYLEMKSALDMRDNADFMKIPRFILGAANRMPDDAAPYLGGHAIMVLGVKYGSAEGLEKPLESKDIRAKVDPYTGLGKIDWWVHYLDGDKDPARRVVIIVVAPPQWGDPIRVCYQKFAHKVPSTKKGECSNQACPRPDKLEKVLADNGWIFCRPDSETRLARGKDIEHLMERALNGRPADPDVVVHGKAIRVTVRDDFLKKYFKAWGDHYNESLATPPFHTAYAALRVDNRTHEEFRNEVREWVSKFNEEWSTLAEMAAVVGRDEYQVSFTITNSNGVSLRRPNLNVHIGGMTFPQDAIDKSRFHAYRIVPQPPREYGTPPRVFLESERAAASLIPVERPRLRRQFDQIVGQYGDDPQGLTLSVRMEDLRAHGKHVVAPDDVFILTYEPDITELVATWEISAADHSRPPYRGETRIPIVDVDVSELLERQLKTPVKKEE
ncbi:hypothetical protein IU450_32820 [Nocardia abscessus]|uniref:hypothetical protein n=1 Tax=Nocardia abscessus TaxID=120957 RepID=UPI0018951301|nr:hypothetical protein [Nocardia abscessus]MBF6340645.1 hypothetical protein [Nocardia abscessus]